LQLLSDLAEKPFAASRQPAVVAPGVFADVASIPLTPADRVTSRLRTFNTVTVDVNANTPSALVNSEVLYPGWRAVVNGKPSKLETANYLFRAVKVPAGASTVRFVYDTSTYRFAAFVSLCGLAALGMMLTVLRAGKSSQSTP
jgi:uncharacterized membrane protein YfhO